jgi:hypothetical protein
MCARCDRDPSNGRFTGRAVLLARRTAREYQRARALNRARWAVALVLLAIVGLASVPCDLYPESWEPGRCARDHWSN